MIDEKIKPVETYLMSISKNIEKDVYELKVGLPMNWTLKETKRISYDVITSNDDYQIITIHPNGDEYCGIDLLIEYLTAIVSTNEKIISRKNEINEKLAEEKKKLNDRLTEETRLLEEKLVSFYNELDELKDSSFKQFENDSSDDEPKEDSVVDEEK